MQLVVFTLGTGTYALPIERVQEIIRDRPRTAGVIPLRGRLLPVRDVAARVGAGAVTAAEPKIVVAELPGGGAGILVDAVDSVVTAAPEQLAPVPAGLGCDHVAAVAQLDGGLVLVLDVDRVLAGLFPEPDPEPAVEPAPKRARPPRRQPSRKRSEKATRSTGGAKTGSPSKVTA